MLERITGGSLASINELPFQVSLQFEGYHVCGGSIISEYWVLSAAHCMQFSKYSMTVLAGSENLQSGGLKYEIDSIIKHDGFDEKWFSNDMAVVKVSNPFKMSESIRPILLFNKNESFPVNKVAIVSGWGKGNLPVHLLHKVQLLTVSREECAAAHGVWKLPPGQVCAGVQKGGKDSCKGDSGGPLTIDGRLAGIISWGKDCGLPKTPGVYSEISYFREWIWELTGV